MDVEQDFKDFVVGRQRSLLRSAYLLAGDWAAAEDLVQTALLRSWPHWGRLARQQGQEAYVRKVLLNAFLSGRRRRWRGEWATEVLPDRAAVPDLGGVDERTALLIALASLPPRQRAVVVLRHVDDLTERQTAAALGCAVGTVKSQNANRTRHRRTSGLVGVGVLAFVGVAGLQALPGAGRAAPTPVARPAVPPGTQVVSYRGIEVFVPREWRIDATRCGTPVEDTVVLPGGVIATCGLLSRPRDVTVVYLDPADDAVGRRLAASATTPAVVSGRPALRGRGTPPVGQQVEREVLVVDGVVVSVQSPDTAAARRILDHVMVAEVDVNGCHRRASLLSTRVPSSGAPLVIGSPTSVSLCRYGEGQLARSTALTHGEAARLLGLLRALPEGVSQPPGGATNRYCQKTVRRGFLVLLKEPQQQITVNISGCRDLGAARPGRSSRLSPELVQDLTRLGGYDTGFPDPRLLRD